MRFVSKKHMPRRTFLSGAGAMLGLPLLDAMVPALTAQTQTAANPPARLGFIYIPLGAVMDQWTPAATGANFEFSPILAPLEPYRNRLLVLSNLSHHQADSLDDTAAPITPAPAPLFSAVFIRGAPGRVRTSAPAPPSIRAAAEHIGQSNRYPSLELTTEDMTGVVGACDTGYDGLQLHEHHLLAHAHHASAHGDQSARDLRAPFRRQRHNRPARRAYRRRPAAFSTRSCARCRPSKATSVRAIAPASATIWKTSAKSSAGCRIAEKQSAASLAVPQAPSAMPDSYDEHAKLMFELLALAYQADQSRIFTFMLARELSQRSYPQVGVPEPHHATSHHQDDPVKLAKLVKIQTYHVTLFAHFLEKLRSTPDGDGSLLDHSVILYGSAMSNSNVHNHKPLPILLAGNVKGNRHLKFAEETPMASLLVTLLNRAGVPVDKVGDSTGPLAEI